ncbi:MBL fold metallo-hydrolase [Halobacteriovorax sp.]|uniref:MBL fold metallo-hydrolase n=1 Tax=Halobacteriovorax sp. TaxID=2020862 RepID=UPI003568DCB2
MKYLFLLSILFLVACTSNHSVQTLKSKNFNGDVFQYKSKNIDKSFTDLLKWKFFGKSTPWPKSIPVKQVKIDKKRVSNETHITFINHSTFLIQNKNINILTDPIWSDRASPLSFMGPKRVRKPAVKLSDLPPIDVILIGHNHYDHLDIETLVKLNKTHSPTFIVGLGVEKLLNENGIEDVISLDWHQTVKKDEIVYRFVPCQHWSARGLFDRNETLWGSFIIEADKRIYFASDTGYSDHFQKQYKAYGKMDISLLPIGAYEPRWFMKEQHLNPRDSVMAHLDLNSKLTIGMHFGTFKLTDEGINMPTEELESALTEFGIKKNEFIAPFFGQKFRIR